MRDAPFMANKFRSFISYLLKLLGVGFHPETRRRFSSLTDLTKFEIQSKAINIKDKPPELSHVTFYFW